MKKSGNETLEPQANDNVISFGRFTVGEASASQDQVLEKISQTKLEKGLIISLWRSKSSAFRNFESDR